MVPTIVIVNGEPSWEREFEGFNVVRRRIQDTGWVLRGRELWAVDASGGVRVDGVLWRVGAIRNSPQQVAALNLIRLAGVPCVNTAAALVRCHDRLSMLAELRMLDIPVPAFDAAVGDGLLRRHRVPLPFVVKVGSNHGGYGKVLVQTDAQWSETSDLIFAADDYATIEPYIGHARDLRCLLVGTTCYGMERRGASWRANVDTIKHSLVAVPQALEDYTRRAAEHLGAVVLALDALERDDGSLVVLESNETPGLTGFPDKVRASVAGLLTARLA